jgi:hypothetical protein
LFAQYVLLRLYCDRVPAGVVQDPDPAGSVRLREEEFKNYALPFYAVVVPEGDRFRTVTTYDRGLIKSVEEFASFLREALEASKKG